MIYPWLPVIFQGVNHGFDSAPNEGFGTIFLTLFNGLIRQNVHWFKPQDGKFDSCATSIETSINSMVSGLSTTLIANLSQFDKKSTYICALPWWRLLYTVFADLYLHAHRKSHVEISRTLEHWLNVFDVDHFSHLVIVLQGSVKYVGASWKPTWKSWGVAAMELHYTRRWHWTYCAFARRTSYPQRNSGQSVGNRTIWVSIWIIDILGSTDERHFLFWTIYHL